jgi:hypothetical protein
VTRVNRNLKGVAEMSTLLVSYPFSLDGHTDPVLKVDTPNSPVILSGLPSVEEEMEWAIQMSVISTN